MKGVSSMLKYSLMIILIFSIKAESDATWEPDIGRKKAECIELVTKGIKYIHKNGIPSACKSFLTDKNWRRGEISLFLLDSKWNILCDRGNTNLIWSNIDFAENNISEPLINSIKNVTNKGQWVNYKWNNSYITTYMQSFVYNRHTYYLGASFFPQTKEYITEQLIDSAKLYFDQVPKDIVFSRVSDSNGSFVMGDITTFISDFEGNILADSFDEANIGQNLIDYQDKNGKYIIKEAIKVASGEMGFGWIESSTNAGLKKMYVKSYTDKLGKKFLLVGCFYVNSTKDEALKLIKDGIDHINKVGTRIAFADFLNPTSPFFKGSISLFVYDLEGKTLADGEYPTLVGKNLIKRKDSLGNFIVQKIIDLAKKHEKGSILSLDKGMYKEILFQMIKVGDESYVIGSFSYNPSKSYSAKFIVAETSKKLKDEPFSIALNGLGSTSHNLFLGDLYPFVYTTEGIILSNGLQKSTLYNLYSKIDNDQFSMPGSELSNLNELEGKWVTFDSNNAKRRVYLSLIPIKRGNATKNVIVGVGYYL